MRAFIMLLFIPILMPWNSCSSDKQPVAIQDQAEIPRNNLLIRVWDMHNDETRWIQGSAIVADMDSKCWVFGDSIAYPTPEESGSAIRIIKENDEYSITVYERRSFRQVLMNSSMYRSKLPVANFRIVGN